MTASPVLGLLGFSYAPRIKGFSKQQRYGFRRRKDYESQGYRIVPDGYINASLIEDHWDQSLRFVVTIRRNQEFLHAEKMEHEMAAGCNRLIRNAIICWNYLYLSQRLAEESDTERRQALLTAFQNGSIVQWHHLNLHGEYDFLEERLRDSVGLDLPKILAVDVP